MLPLQRLLAHLAVLLGSGLIAGCSNNQASPDSSGVQTQGIVRAYQFNGEAVLIDHEAIPGRMEAMRMSFRVDSPEAWTEIPPGTKITFTMIEQDLSHVALRPEPLPDSVQLNLAPPADPIVPRND